MVKPLQMEWLITIGKFVVLVTLTVPVEEAIMDAIMYAVFITRSQLLLANLSTKLKKFMANSKVTSFSQI